MRLEWSPSAVHDRTAAARNDAVRLLRILHGAQRWPEDAEDHAGDWARSNAASSASSG